MKDLLLFRRYFVSKKVHKPKSGILSEKVAFPYESNVANFEID
jgi:hypothetical protein